ncbi:MAG: S26 family signal peptidase [Candidatus Methanomethylophilaceae archaeon]|nr:S26 family signal peptidase [Candidatus Methanomethylophilaceae archaeon]
MKRGNKVLIAICGFLLICIVGGYVGIHVASGLDSPLSVIMSSSMQHYNEQSAIGVIDTGDVMVVQDPNKANIQSYIEGLTTGHKTFGDYGSVLIYDRGDDVNPCIHRAIVWLEYNGNGTWSAPSLQTYTAWTCTGSTDFRSLSGTLYFTDITQSHKEVSINLDNLGKQSGYLTMGDNPESNKYFDQAVGIISHPVGTDDIRSVALYELPWLGVIKVYMTPSKRAYLDHVPNSIYSIIALFVMVFAIIYSCDVFYQKKELKQKQKELERLEEL